jgi:small subunit ribosomal protein S24e
MKLEINEKKENKLLDRLEVKFYIKESGPTPKRNEVREQIATKLGIKPDGIILDWLEARYGEQVTVGYAKVYKSLEAASKVEPKYLIKRNASQLESKKEGKEDAKE